MQANKSTGEKQNPLACPMCDAPMEPGSAMICHTTLGILFGGWSSPMFFNNGSEPPKKILSPNKHYRGHRCPQCDLLVIIPR